MESILREFTNIDWITIVLVISLFVLVLSKTFFYTKFINFVVLPFNNKYVLLHNKKHILFNWFNFLWCVFMGLNISLFVYYIINMFSLAENYNSINGYFVIFGLLALFFSIKIMLQFGNSYVFNSNTIITQFVFKKLSYLNYSAMVMFFANVFLTYIAPNSKAIVYFCLVLIIVINIIGWVNLLRNYRKFLTLNFFYFILYLCALEISPLLIIGNYLKY